MEQTIAVVPEVLLYVHRKCSPEWIIETRIIDFHDITYVVSGAGCYIIDDERFEVSAGDLIYIPPDRKRQAWTAAGSPMELYALNFFSDDMLPFGPVSQLGYDPKLLTFYSQLTRCWMEREEMYQLDAGALTLQIISELYRRLCKNKPVNHLDDRIERVKNYINENYQEKLSLSNLARLVGLSPVYLGALFSQKEACSVKEYINKVRIQNAYEIIRTERLSVNDVALDCGYTDAFYFSRVFKKYMGVSPSKV
jgi:AraC-like DNA-binding protein